MLHDKRSWMGCGILLAGAFILKADAATISGQNGYTVQAYGSLLAGATPSSGGTGINQQLPAPGVDGNNAYARLRKDSAGNVTDGYFQYTAGSTFTAGTVISWRQNNGGGPQGNALVELGATQVQNLTDGDWKVTVSVLPSPISTTTARVEYPNGLGVLAPTTLISDLNELQAFPDKLTLITGITKGDCSPVYYSDPIAMFNGVMDNAWFPAAATDRYASFNLPGSRSIGAIIIDAEGGSDPLDVQRWNGSAWVTFAHVSYSANEIISMAIPGGVTTSQIRFDLGNGADMRGFQEVLLFEVSPVPEPAAMTLLALGAILGARRRQR